MFYGATTINGWDVVYHKAINDDGSLFFPQKLSREFLERTKRTMGSYLFANQYLNQVIPKEDMTFKPEWIRYHSVIPRGTFTFITIDPAISQADTADFTGTVVCDVDHNSNKYVRLARRKKMTPTEIVEDVFRLNEEFKPMSIGIESVAYQKALLYFIHAEMRKRKVVLPLCEIKHQTDKSKEARILSLVPWFEWGHITLAQGLTDLELELTSFPRGAHDDILDALAMVDQIAITPTMEANPNVRPAPNSPNYEKWYIQNIQKIEAQRSDGGDDNSGETW